MCLYPKLIKNPKYRPTKKNGYRPPKCTDERLLYIPASCGYCIECRRQKANQWLTRIAEEQRGHKNALFVTLTISPENYEKIGQNTLSNNDIMTIAVRRWLERIRKETGKSVKHWIVTELGGEFGRVHLHGILWDTSRELIEKTWNYGFTYIGDYVNESTVNYIVKYMTKIDEKHKDYIPKVLCSAGIGNNYTQREDYKRNAYKENEETNETYRLRDGRRVALPYYYRNKRYSEEEREKLWIQKIEKGVTWVDKEKCIIGSEEYYKLLDRAREKYKELTHCDETTWDEIKYKKRLEKQRRYYSAEYQEQLKRKLSKEGDTPSFDNTPITQTNDLEPINENVLNWWNNNLQ